MEYRELIENAPDAIIVVSNGKLLFANQAAADLVGLSDLSSISKHDVLDFTLPSSRETVKELSRKLHQERTSASMVEVTVLRTNGETREVELMTRPIAYEGSHASVVFMRDVTARKKAERALQQSEERYRQMVESMNEALVVLGPDKRVKFVNPQFCKMFDCLPDDVIGKDPGDLYDPETKTLLERNLDRRKKGVYERYEAELKTKSGKAVVANISAAPLFCDGEFTGSMSLLSDITSLRRTERRHRDLIDSLPDLIFSVDCDNRHTAANKACCRVLGLEEPEIIGRTIAELGIASHTARILLDQLTETRLTGRTQTREVIIDLPAVGIRTLRRVTSPIYGEGGQIVGVSGVGTDITDQRASEEATQKLFRAVEQMEEIMFITDRNGVITYVNPAFLRVYDYSRDEVIGKTPRVLKSGELLPEDYQQLWTELLDGRSFRTEYRNRRKDGSLVDVIASASPLFDHDGQVTGFIAIQQDVTEQKRAAEERRHLDERLTRLAKMEALGTLAGGIAHDFNNILAIIQTHATLLERRQGDPTRNAAAAATLKQAVQRGASLSKQILTFARKAEIKPEFVNIAKLVMELASMISETFPRTVQITLDLDPATPLISADAGQLHQALLNLCVNARDAMPGGGRLTIGARLVSQESIRSLFAEAESKDYVCITVADTGTGMDGMTRRRIFEPFFTTKEKGQGTGLGLAVVYGVINSHGGLIDVDSEIGRGTKFRLYFPIVSTPSESGLTEQPIEAPGGTETLLIVDDEPAILMALDMQLSSVGYRVFTAANGPEAIEVCKRVGQSLDGVIMDLGMPKMSAADLVKALHNLAPGTPVIAMTGYVDAESHANVVAAGVKSIIQKPFDFVELQRCLRDVIDADPHSGFPSTAKRD